MPNKNTESIWKEYRDSLLPSFLSSLEENDYLDSDKQSDSWPQNILATTSIRDAVKLMRGVVSEEKIELLRVRFRSYKYRKSKEKKTLQIEDSTHKWIMDAKKEHFFDTVDEALYHLLNPVYSQQLEWKEERAQVADTPINTDKNFIASLLERLSSNDRKMVLLTIEKAFLDGWTTAKSSRSKKPSAKGEATVSYMKRFEKDN